MKKTIALAVALLMMMTVPFVVSEIPRACSTPETMFPFCNTSLTLDERLDDLIGRLDILEKPVMLTARASPKGDVKRLGLPAYDWGANCIHGVQSRCGSDGKGGSKCPTSFPCPNALGASFNESMWHSMGSIIGIELRSLWLQGVGEFSTGLPKLGLDCWSPNININRAPEWGRNMEVPSEDPYMTGRFGVAITKGLQNGTLDDRYLQAIVTLKHWAAYSVEAFGNATRHNFDAKVCPFDLADTYFPAWKASVEEAKAAGVMCSYNALNGVPTCASSFLNETLRNEWGFDGYITSDSGAVKDIWLNHHYTETPWGAAAVAMKDGGCDIDSGEVYEYGLYEALLAGEIHEHDINLALRRTLGLRFKLGLFDPIDDQPYWHIPPEAVRTQESLDLSLLSSKESLVLLKNDDNILPLDNDENLSIAVIGPHSKSRIGLVGNYLGQMCPGPDHHDDSCIESPLEAITKHNTGTTSFAAGCAISGDDKSGISSAVELAKNSDIVILMLGTDLSVENESHDRTSIDFPGVQNDLAAAVIAANPKTVLVMVNGGMLALDSPAGSSPGIIESFFPGFFGAEAIASVIFGEYSPGGRLPITIYPADYVHQQDFLDMDMTKPPGRTYRYYTGNATYEFGAGLSYTQFKLEWSTSTSTNINTQDNAISISAPTDTVYTCKVTNVGSMTGDEVVLAFFVPSNMNIDAPVPIKRLFGFERVRLSPGESKTVSFTLTDSMLSMTNQMGKSELVTGSGEIVLTGLNDDFIAKKITIVE